MNTCSMFATVSQRIQYWVQNVKCNSPRRCFGNHQCYEQSGVYSSKQELPAIAGGEGQYSIIEWSTMGRQYPAIIELEDIHKDHFTIKINWRVKPVE